MTAEIHVEREDIFVRHADTNDTERWNDFVGRCDGAGPFHLRESLEVMADHSTRMVHPFVDTTARTHLLVGYKGEELVGIFPAFEIEKGPLSAVFSPLPNFEIPYLGPGVFAFDSMKRRSRETRHFRFVTGCLDLLERVCDPSYFIVRTSPQFEDVRPFLWSDFVATPRHTHVVDLTASEEEILGRFSKSARNNLRVDDDSYTIEEGDAGDAARIVEQVAARHAEQGETFLLEPQLVVDLYRRLPEGVVRPYVLRIDGEFVGGNVVLEHGDVAFAWQGGVKPDVDLPVNELLDWTIMCDAKRRGRTHYDLLGANKRRLSQYKSKFGSTLETYYSLERARPGLQFASRLYKQVR